MKTAVIRTGGKQHLVQEGDKIKVEKLAVDENKKTEFKEVLLTATDKTAKIGTPFLKGATVEAKVLRHGHHQKITGVKMKAKKRHKKYFGHKQHYTEIEITSIKTR
ncbi:MAG: 50S ribosomal protein L21 [bacterium]